MAEHTDFQKFSKAVRELNLDPKKVKATSHSSAVTDFSTWDQVQEELNKESEENSDK